MRVVRDRIRSSHLVGEPEARVRVNAVAADYGRAGAVLPAGSLLVVSQDGGEGTLHFVMERSGSPEAASAPPRWEYAVVDASGWVLARGRIPTCVRCHEEAPVDEVFGPAGLAPPPPEDEAQPTSPSTHPSL